MVWAYQEIGQNSVRDALAWLLPVSKGAIPRLKVSFKA